MEGRQASHLDGGWKEQDTERMVNKVAVAVRWSLDIPAVLKSLTMATKGPHCGEKRFICDVIPLGQAAAKVPGKSEQPPQYSFSNSLTTARHVWLKRVTVK